MNVDHGEEPEVVEHQKKHEHDCCQEHRWKSEKPEHEIVACKPGGLEH